jgi:hypothetical protein
VIPEARPPEPSGPQDTKKPRGKPRLLRHNLMSDMTLAAHLANGRHDIFDCEAELLSKHVVRC